MKDFKQVIVVRTDLKLSKGKLATQVAHASSEASLKADKKIIFGWKKSGMKKIVLKGDSKEHLYRLLQESKDRGLVTSLIQDAGKTEVTPGTVTALAIGPASEDEIDKLTKDLKMI